MSRPDILQAVCLVTYAIMLLLAAWRDWQTLQIADVFPLMITGAFGVWAVGGYVGGRTSAAEIAFAAAAALVLLVVGAAAFAAGVLGGGDVKLLAAAGLFAGPAHVVAFLLVVALAGGALALAVLAGTTVGPRAVDDAGLSRRLPYGPAIAAGGLWVTAARLFV